VFIWHPYESRGIALISQLVFAGVFSADEYSGFGEVNIATAFYRISQSIAIKRMQ